MQKLKSEKGMLVVEATIVFPVMFLVIFFLFFMGNAYYQKCKVEAVVNQVAIEGAAYCSDPMLQIVDTTGAVPGFNGASSKPYRYILGGMNDVEAYSSQQMTKKLGDVGTGLFSGMEPMASTPNIKFHNYFVYSTYSVDLEYKMLIPIRLLGQKEFSYMQVKASCEAPVTDVPEFIRNANMVEDYAQQAGVDKKIENVISSVKKFLHIG